MRTGSIVELNVIVRRAASVEALAEAFRDAAASSTLHGILGVLEGDWASSRVVGDTHSSLVDVPLLRVLDDHFVSTAAWYDNEMGYATRLAETVAFLSEGGPGGHQTEGSMMALLSGVAAAREDGGIGSACGLRRVCRIEVLRRDAGGFPDSDLFRVRVPAQDTPLQALSRADCRLHLRRVEPDHRERACAMILMKAVV